ncbi:MULTISPECIES: hypothetical protein [unclassified Sphingobacterium]|uniref:hypothetical protein n=1 Tax=unclassified Sphingobacterium TaxID=2609468 RepID=UPI00265C9194|nr:MULTISPECIES: hypothetical protein [unclassified Sphingobacterium]WKK59629.1 hypothetical protein QYC40_05185 [Sphingobacterium sp. BN32]
MKLVALKPSSIIELLFVVAILLNIANYQLIQRTLIPLECVAYYFVIGIFVYLLFSSLCKFQWMGRFELFMYFISIFGTYLTFLCLMVNVLFSGSKVQVKNYKMQRITNRLVGRDFHTQRQQVGLVTFENGRNKRVYHEQIVGAENEIIDSIAVHLSEGLFNFPIIRKIETID